MDIVNTIIIEPFKSVGGFQLGDARKNIIKKFGKASLVIENNIMENIKELREAKELVYVKAGRTYVLDHVLCLKDTNPFIGDTNIFEAGLDRLKEIDGDFLENDHYTTFRTLGISVGGLGNKKIPEKRLVIAWRPESLKVGEYFASEK